MNDYIKSMRRLIGHAPLLICGASVIVVNGENGILLEKRKDNGCWGYPGGCVELYETTEDAAKRELFEETGLEADSLELYGVFSGPDLHYIYPNGDEVSGVDVLYLCRHYKGTLKCEESEVSELRFFAPGDIPENLSPPIANIIRGFVCKMKT